MFKSKYVSGCPANIILHHIPSPAWSTSATFDPSSSQYHLSIKMRNWKFCAELIPLLNPLCPSRPKKKAGIHEFSWCQLSVLVLVLSINHLSHFHSHCISYLLLCNKLPQSFLAQNNKYLLCHSSCGSGIQKWLS